MANGDDDDTVTPEPAALEQPGAPQPPLSQQPSPTATPPASGAAPAAPPPRVSHTADLLKQQQVFGEEEQQLMQRKREQLDPLMASQMRSMAQPRPRPPRQEQAAPFKSPGMDAQVGWANAAMLIGAIGGALVRAPAGAALQGMAEMNKGMAEGNIKAYDQAYKTWKANAEQVKEKNTARMQEYRMVLEDRKYDLDQKAAMFELVANKWKDDYAALAAREKNWDKISELVMKDDEAQTRHDEKMAAVQDHHEMMVSKMMQKGTPQWMEYMRQLKETDPDAYNENIQILKDTNPKMQNQQQEKNTADGEVIAKGMETGDIPPVMTGYGRGVATAATVALANRGTDFSKLQLQYKEAQRQVNSMESPQQLRLAQVLQQSAQEINRVRTLANQLDMTDFRWWNEKKMRAEVEADPGSPRLALVRQYLSAVAALRGDISQVESGGYAAQQSSWEAANKQINESDDVSTMNAALDELQRTTSYRLKAMQAGFGNTQQNPYTSKVVPPPPEETPAPPGGQVAGPGAPPGTRPPIGSFFGR